MATKTKKPTASKVLASKRKTRADEGGSLKSRVLYLLAIVCGLNLIASSTILFLTIRHLSFEAGFSLPSGVAREASTGLPIPESVQAFSAAGEEGVDDGGGVWISDPEETVEGGNAGTEAEGSTASDSADSRSEEAPKASKAKTKGEGKPKN